jgi:hypothetical protein
MKRDAAVGGRMNGRDNGRRIVGDMQQCLVFSVMCVLQ